MGGWERPCPAHQRQPASAPPAQLPSARSGRIIEAARRRIAPRVAVYAALGALRAPAGGFYGPTAGQRMGGWERPCPAHQRQPASAPPAQLPSARSGRIIVAARRRIAPRAAVSRANGGGLCYPCCMPSLPQRFPWHDFTRPGWYHITIECAARGRNVLARIDGGGLELSPLGKIATSHFKAMASESGGAIAIHAFQAMPDHLHALIHVAKRLPRPLGSFVGAFKAAATSAARRQIGLVPGTSIWKPGFDWERKRTPKEVAMARLYVEGNPTAAVEKRKARAKWGLPRPVSHPRLPSSWPVHPPGSPAARWMPGPQEEEICGPVPQWSAFGNLELLDSQRLFAVRVSHREPEARIAAMEEKTRKLAKEGAVPVSPAISPGEKRVLSAALLAGGSAIHVECRAIDIYYKPGPLRMATCAEGRFLAISPLPARPGRHAPRLTKPLAERLNLCAREIAALGAR